MKPVILFRQSMVEKEELEIAKKYFDVTFSRVNLQDKLVIGRYSVLPFYKELDEDLKMQGSKLVNSFFDHSYIASFDYYHDVADLTFKTWFRLSDLPEEGPFVVKGVTNSRKHEWKTKMFAKTKRDAVMVASELSQDSLIGSQDIIVRKFTPLEKVDEGINDLPMSNEWRFFFYKDQMLTHGFYWSSTDKRGQMDQTGLEFSQKVASRLKDRLNFYVMDIAKTQTGEWILVELNDGQMSGLSECNVEELYKNLLKAIENE